MPKKASVFSVPVMATEAIESPANNLADYGPFPAQFPHFVGFWRWGSARSVKEIREFIDTAKERIGQSVDCIFRIHAASQIPAPDTLDTDGLSWEDSAQSGLIIALRFVGTFAALLDDPQYDTVIITLATMPNSPGLLGSPTKKIYDSPFRGIAEFCKLIEKRSQIKRNGRGQCEWVMLACNRIG